MRYPVSIDLAGKACLVVGAGKVAERKLKGLIEAGAVVTVVAPAATGEIAALAKAGKITLVRRSFQPGDERGAFMVFAASGDGTVNLEAAKLGKKAGALVNSADGGEGDFTLPAVARRGGVTVAVDTAGSSPALAAWLRDRIDSTLPAGLDVLAEVLKAARAAAKTGGEGEPWKKLLESGFPEDMARGDWANAAEKLELAFGPDARSCAARIFEGR